ncbi:hypothetical protein KC340_g17818 [Hortaea werneckii]|nr:hypothetical protein KC342_g18104 [Hortaea werneckii]KAI7056643.1 hypothetical protein KC339_g18136 [Hortaea werneckii]KAI7205805.1 hypothetical protein KC365_g17535 [Hortaea werneckii]KAI7289019.1 hypothetical protein KC340_g17818 [Hortaea werneckii]KAI7373138.1 hypothetical protein KC328_g16800 [Hortaea werneckii]
MFSEQQLQQSADQLAGFRHSDIRHQESLTSLLDSYSVLIDQYNRLRSDYEEERDARERYKQMARGQERDPFVMVLVDGDGYVFNDDFIRRGAEGGQNAAQSLKDNINRSLRWKGLEGCRIMVRVYANLVGLSKSLAKAGLAGKEKRSLATFAASFTQSNDLFDFVDAGESEESANFKIRTMFRQSVNNAQCKHIFFVGCHDEGYIDELAPYSSHRERITLVGSGTFHHEFTKVGLRIENFPMLFRSTTLKGGPAPQNGTSDEIAHAPTKPTPTAQPVKNASNGEGETPKVCGFFKKGRCKNGKNCRFLHTQDSPNGSTENMNGKSNDSKVGDDESSKEKSPGPFNLSKLNQTDNDFMNGHAPSPAHQNGTPTAQPKSQDPLQNLFDFATGLPQASSVPTGKVPVNKTGDRLDIYIEPPSPYDLDQFKHRTSKQKLCNDHHLAGVCPRSSGGGDTCPFDHSPISDGVYNALKQVAYGVPCPKKSACRRPGCLKGHCCLDGPGYDSWAPPSPPAQAQRDASGWDDPRPVPLAQPATEGWDSVRPTMAVNYGWDAPRPVASSGEW